MSSGGSNPFFDVYRCRGLDIQKVFTYPADRFYNQKEGQAVFVLTDRQKKACTLAGDVKIIFKHAGFTNKTICRIMFNTAFIQRGNYIKAGKCELSPEDIRKDKGKILPNDFIVHIFFEDYCNVCSPYETEIKDLCDKCKKIIGEETINEWLQVKEILDTHDFPNKEAGRRLMPNVDQDLIDLTLSKNLAFNPNYYRIWKPEELEAAENEQK